MDSPGSSISSNKRLGLFTLLALATIVGIGAGWRVLSRTQEPEAAINRLYTVVPVDIDVKVVKDGELQAVNNFEISCAVEGQTTIQSVVPEGTRVSAGDVILTLDSARLEDRIESTRLQLFNTESALARAQQMVETQISQNATRLQNAEVGLQLAQLELKRYHEGAYPQQLTNTQTDVQMAEINVRNAEEKLSQTRALLSKGYTNAAALQADEFTMMNAENARNRSQATLRVLTEYTHAMQFAAKESAVKQAEQDLARTKSENAADMAWRNANLQSREQSLALLKRRMERLQIQFEACTIKAPADGLVIYASSGMGRGRGGGGGGMGGQRTIIEEGALVHESQVLLRLPETSTMKALIRVSEKTVPHLKIGLRARVKIVGVPVPQEATLTRVAILPDSGMQFDNPDIREYPVDITLDNTPPGLMPGMGTLSEILVDQAVGVIAAPISAIHASSRGSYVFVKLADRIEPRKIDVGRTNQSHAEVLDDVLQEGDQLVLLDPHQMEELLVKAGL